MVIDSHVHVFPPSLRQRRGDSLLRDRTFAELYDSPKARMATAEELVAAMDAAGVERAALLNIGWASHECCVETNRYLLEAASRYKGRLVPFCSVNPTAGQAAIDEVGWCAKAGARGIGELHPDTQGFDLGDKALLAPLMAVAREHRLVLEPHASEPLAHRYAGKGRTTPDVLERFILSFPGQPIVCAHWGGGLPFYALMPEVRKALANVYFDSAASPFLYRPEVFQRVADLVGADHILFGTDYPLISHQRLLEQVEQSGLPEAAKHAILAGNASKLLGPPVKTPPLPRRERAGRQ